MSNDPNQTSTKLRTKAIEIIKSTKRPMASHEIINWIRKNDTALASLIDSKCSDYVRIILSVTQDNTIVKYKSLVPIQGVDKRSTFYGLSNVTYPPSEWAILSTQTKSSSKGNVKHNKPLKKTTNHCESMKISFPNVQFTSNRSIFEDCLSFDEELKDFSFLSDWNTNFWTDVCYYDF